MMVLQPVVGSRGFLNTPTAADFVCNAPIEGTIIKIDASISETSVESTYYFNL